MAAEPKLTLPALRAMTDRGEIDTIILAAPDMQGRLQGKRVMPKFFFDSVTADSAEGCAYLLATDIECGTVPGYELTSWDKGYGDFVFAPDLATLRLAPWQDKTAIILCDIELHGHKPADVSPRTMLKKQLDRLQSHGFTAWAATELEFIMFRNSYEDAWNKAYRGLTPANQYNNDYSILGTARVEPIIRRIRNAMEAAGIQVENSKGECNLGQHEINFRYGPAVDTCDKHVIYKEAAKEIAAQENVALTFMAKFNEREGNSCHTHLSLRNEAGDAVFLDADGHSPSRNTASPAGADGWRYCLALVNGHEGEGDDFWQLPYSSHAYRRYAGPAELCWPDTLALHRPEWLPMARGAPVDRLGIACHCDGVVVVVVGRSQAAIRVVGIAELNSSSVAKT